MKQHPWNRWGYSGAQIFWSKTQKAVKATTCWEKEPKIIQMRTMNFQGYIFMSSTSPGHKIQFCTKVPITSILHCSEHHQQDLPLPRIHPGLHPRLPCNRSGPLTHCSLDPRRFFFAHDSRDCWWCSSAIHFQNWFGRYVFIDLHRFEGSIAASGQCALSLHGLLVLGGFLPGTLVPTVQRHAGIRLFVIFKFIHDLWVCL